MSPHDAHIIGSTAFFTQMLVTLETKGLMAVGFYAKVCYFTYS